LKEIKRTWALKQTYERNKMKGKSNFLGIKVSIDQEKNIDSLKVCFFVFG